MMNSIKHSSQQKKKRVAKLSHNALDHEKCTIIEYLFCSAWMDAPDKDDYAAICRQTMAGYKSKLEELLNGPRYIPVVLTLIKTQKSFQKKLNNAVEEFVTSTLDAIFKLENGCGDEEYKEYAKIGKNIIYNNAACLSSGCLTCRYLLEIVNLVPFTFRQINDIVSNLNQIKQKEKHVSAYFDAIMKLNNIVASIAINDFLNKLSLNKVEMLERMAEREMALSVYFKILELELFGSSYKIVRTLSLVIKAAQFEALIVANESIYSKNNMEQLVALHGQKSMKKRWSALDEHYNNAIAMARERWENGDQSLHYTMAKDILEEINDQIRDVIRAELLDKYPARDTEEKKAAFEAEMKKRFNYETISLKTLKEKLKDTAKEFEKYFDPGEDSRK